MAQTNIGWECPKCGRTYSPYTQQCKYCGPVPASVSSSTSTHTKVTTGTSTIYPHQFIPMNPNETLRICTICGQPENGHPLVILTT